MTTATQFTEEGTSKTVQAMGQTIHYHEVGEGYPPVLMFHSFGPGTTAWITWHKVLPISRSTSAASPWTCRTSPRPAPLSTNEHDP